MPDDEELMPNYPPEPMEEVFYETFSSIIENTKEPEQGSKE